MDKTTRSNLPVLKNINELSDFISSYWIQMIEKGRFEMPFQGKDKLTDIANIIRFIQTGEDLKVFTKEQIELIYARTRRIFETELLKRRSLYAYTAYSSPHGYLEKMFSGISVPHGCFPFEIYIKYFSSRLDYEESLDESRCGGAEGKKEIMKNYPSFDGVICQNQSGGYWKIIALVEPDHSV